MRRRRPGAVPDPPELPDGARPAWPPWHAPVALFGALGAISVAGIPLVPVILIADLSEDVAGVVLLVLLLVQDSLLVVAALFLASSKLRLRAWHFGIRAAPLWPTVSWTALGFALMLGFELGYIELLQVDSTNVEELGEESLVAGLAVATAVIVVAPVAEEVFFRAFFYRALRSRLSVWPAALIDGAVFGSLHFQGLDAAVILPVIAVVGVGQCLVYERTGSLFAVIAIHAAFNTVAMFPIVPVTALVIGAAVILACALAPLAAGRWPSPVAT